MKLYSNIKSVLLTCAAAAATLSAGAQAASFVVQTPFPNPFNVAPAAFTETFESYGVGTWDTSTVTNVGTFSPLSPPGTGSGSTCGATNGGSCTELYLTDFDINGQGNITPTAGLKALQANDTFGMVWNVAARDGREFNDIFFGIRDAADQGATFTVSLDSINGVATSLVSDLPMSGLGNNGTMLLSLAIGSLVPGPVTSAQISLVSSKLNDSFTFDGGAITAVPLPAALPLFLSALAGFGFMSTSRKRRAA